MTEKYKNSQFINNFKNSIEEHFCELEDYRRENSIQHKLLDILFITICAVISGTNNIKETSEYAKSKKEWFDKILKLKNGVPSYNTFWLTFRLLDPVWIERCFVKWVQSMTNITKGGSVAIDGKAQKGTADKDKPNSFVHIVSAWSTENGLTLGQLKVEGKSNEITAIPKLLEMINVEDNVVTIDAMGCQKEIAKEVNNKKGDYILALKGNQGALHAEVTNFFQQAKEYGDEGIDFSSSYSEEKGHGRSEKRKIYISENIDFLSQKSEWLGLKTVICVNSERVIKNKKSEETKYYISSLSTSAEKFSHFIRYHWHIENKAHWILDVAFKEDAQKAKAGNIPENLSLLRRIALNYLKQDKTVKAGIEIKRKKAGWDNNYLLKILGVKSFS